MADNIEHAHEFIIRELSKRFEHYEKSAKERDDTAAQRQTHICERLARLESQNRERPCSGLRQLSGAVSQHLTAHEKSSAQWKNAFRFNLVRVLGVLVVAGVTAVAAAASVTYYIWERLASLMSKAGPPVP